MKFQKLYELILWLPAWFSSTSDGQLIFLSTDFCSNLSISFRLDEGYFESIEEGKNSFLFSGDRIYYFIHVKHEKDTKKYWKRREWKKKIINILFSGTCIELILNCPLTIVLLAFVSIQSLLFSTVDVGMLVGGVDTKDENEKRR